MKILLPALVLTLLIAACRTPEKSFLSGYLNTGNLPLQSFTINPDKDTTLTSSGGVRIKIAKGSFASGGPVTIAWKEALNFNDILKAGLLTQNGKNLLRSGGMFYFNTKEKRTIEKPIGIDVPTETISGGMQLYQGDSADGKMDWQDPKPIENVKAFGENATGKAIFKAHCATCHRLEAGSEVSTILGIKDSRSKEWLYAVTRNPYVMAEIDPVMRCLKCRYGVMMPAFPGLAEADMDSIYDYIDYETVRQRVNGTTQGVGCSNCTVLNPAYDSLLGVYNKLYNEHYFQKDPILFAEQDSLVNQAITNPIQERSKEFIQGKNYYNVTIQSDGWYNIDALLKEWSGAVPGKLFVKAQGKRNEEVEYYLAIPAMKILVTGSEQENGDVVVFYEADGSIPLPLQRQAFVIAVGGADNQYFYAKKEFIISGNQTITLPVQTVSKQQFDAQMNEIAYYGLNTKVENVVSEPDLTTIPVDKSDAASKTAISPYERSLLKIEKQLKQLSANKLKDCGCGEVPSAAARRDTTNANDKGGQKFITIYKRR